MLRQPMLTVIMPVYNMEKYLGRALEALTKQKDRNFKLLIVNIVIGFFILILLIKKMVVFLTLEMSE